MPSVGDPAPHCATQWHYVVAYSTAEHTWQQPAAHDAPGLATAAAAL
jgi:hypothetical protein